MLRDILLTVLNIIFGVIAFFLGFRIIFELFSANPQTPFVAWIYAISEGLIYPFRGIFPNQDIAGFSLDIVALVTLLAYGIVIYLVMAIIDSLITPRIRVDRVDEPSSHRLL